VNSAFKDIKCELKKEFDVIAKTAS
jgi:hypothetical protein